MELSRDEVVARWPGLAPLAELTDPPWRFTVLRSGVLTGTRTHESYVEALWVIDEWHTGLNRRPIAGRWGSVVTLNYSGPLHDAVSILEKPPELDP